MKIIPRQFILVAAELFGSDLRQIKLYKASYEKGEISFSEYVCLVDGAINDRLSELWTDCWDAKMQELRNRWNKIAESHEEDFDDTEDPVWIAADRRLNRRHEQLERQLLREFEPELYAVRRRSEKAYFALSSCGNSSLHGDPNVIPVHPMTCAESFRIDFRVALRPQEKKAA